MCWERINGTEIMKTKKRVVACILGSVGCAVMKMKKYFVMSLAGEMIFEEHNSGEGTLGTIRGNRSK